MGLLGANTDLIRSDGLRDAEGVMTAALKRYKSAMLANIPLRENRCQTDGDIQRSIEDVSGMVESLMTVTTEISGGHIENIDDMAKTFDSAEEADTGSVNTRTGTSRGSH